MKQVPSPPFWGGVRVKKWSPFFDSGARSPIFGHLKMPKVLIFKCPKIGFLRGSTLIQPDVYQGRRDLYFSFYCGFSDQGSVLLEELPLLKQEFSRETEFLFVWIFPICATRTRLVPFPLPHLFNTLRCFIFAYFLPVGGCSHILSANFRDQRGPLPRYSSFSETI